MTTLALWAQEAPEGTGLSETFRLLDLPAAWIVVLVILPALAGVCWLGYRGERLTNGAKGLLTALRFAALLLLFLVLCRPVVVQRREEVQQAEVVVLVDDSASMRRKDAYRGDPVQREALAAFSSASLESTTRSELARSALEGELLPLLEKEGYVPRLFRFGADVSPATRPIELSAGGHATHVGDAIVQALAAHRGRHVTDVVVLSDGRQNGGVAVAEAARTAHAAGVPVHTVVIGDTRPERNAVIELVEAPTSALEGDEVAITVRVSGRGVGGAERVGVLLEELDPASASDDLLRVVAESEVTLAEAGERVTLVARPGPADESTGERRFQVTVPPIEGETLLDDNRVEVAVHVTPEKVRVLYVDGYPRYEYRFLKEVLKRADENVEVSVFLLSATPDFPQEASRGVEPLTRVPTGRRELLDNYDVIVLGDVNPLSVSPDPAEGEEFMRSIVEFVERGGGLLFIAGEYDNPRAYVNTPLEAVFPVVLDSSEMLAAEPDTTRLFHPRLEDPANPHEIVRLAPDAEVNRRLWEDEGGLHGMYWYLPVGRAKPGAQVLLRHPTDGTARHGNYPLAVTGYYPSGRTLFLAFDATWRWRFHYGDRYHERFWRNAIRWLALGRLRSGDRRYRLELARSSYNLGDRIVVEARVLDEDYRPSEAAAQDVRWGTPDERPTDETLEPVAGRPGLYRGTLAAERPGLHRVWMEGDGGRLASAEFEVVLPSAENQDPAPAPEVLRELSVLSGGLAVDLAGLAALAEAFPGDEERREAISSRLEDLWDSWGTLLAALGLLAAEWILRKRLELV